MLQSLQLFYGITVIIRKNRIFHSFFEFSPWSRNNYVMIPTTWQYPVNFTPKNYTSKLNFEKKKISIPERGFRFGLKIGKRPFWDVGRIFFFVEKKVDHSVSRGEIYRRLPECCNPFNMISGSQSKVEKTKFFIVFSTLYRDPKIIM